MCVPVYRSELFSPTALVNLPAKKLTFDCPDLFPELTLEATLSAPAPQEEPIQVRSSIIVHLHLV